MYWCKKRSLVITAFSLLVVFLAACKPDTKETNFFDLKGYFTKEAARLQKQNKPVFKTVEHNGVVESKKVNIVDWNAELILFKESDINKPAWSSSYDVTSDSSITIYKAKDADLRTKELIIKRANGKVKWILVYNHVKNMLYETHEKLSYFPDSLYLIEKMQAVRILGINRYRVKGSFAQ
jgi:hypothetical protein